MTFSIVVPIYNVEKYLAQCIESILCQTFKDFELILVNDGSKDNSAWICDEYETKDNRIHVIHKENAGVAAARNSGIRAATGTYVCFLDGDDYWKDKHVLQKINACIINNNADIVQLNYCFFDEKKQEIIYRNQKYFDNETDIEYKEKLFQLIRTDCLTASAWGTVISREYINRYSLYFIEGVKNTEDVEWAIRAFACKPQFCVLNEEVYVYRKNREGAVTSTICYVNLCQHVETIVKSIEFLEDKSEEIRIPIMNYIMYQIIIAIGLLHSASVKQFTVAEKKGLNEKLRPLFRKNIGTYHEQKKVNLAAKVYSLVGYKMMAKILGIYLDKRER